MSKTWRRNVSAALSVLLGIGITLVSQISPANAAITTTFTGYGLHEIVRYTGKYQASTSGFSGGNPSGGANINQNGTGTLAVLQPDAGATVVKAYLSSEVTYYSGGYAEAPRPPVVSLAGQNVNFYAKNWASPFTNFLADVTPLVQAYFATNPAPTGTSVSAPWNGTKFNIPVTYEAVQSPWGQPTYSDGVALTVVFQNTAMTSEASVVYYFGSSNSGGQTFSLNFDTLPALAGGASYSGSWLSLGIGWSQGGGQYSNIKAQNNVQVAQASSSFGAVGSPWTDISGSAGGCDDSKLSDGVTWSNACDTQFGLISVGGVGDSTANPASIAQGVADDELYNLDNLLAAGVNRIDLNTKNPSGDDNIFQAVLSVPFILSGTVIFDNNTGSGTMANQVSLTSAQLNANTFTKNTWNFVGWNTLADGTGTPYVDRAVYSFSTDMTLFAQWSQNTHVVTYDTHGGNAVTSTNYTGTINSFPASPTKAGATFAGWFIAATGGTALATPYTPASFADITLHAQWTVNAPPPAPEPEVFTAKFDTQGGSEVANHYFTYRVDLPSAPTKQGFNFSGWFTSPSGGTALTSPYGPSPLANITLYAQWTQKVYIVRFNTQGGPTIADRTFTDKIVLPSSIARKGYLFTGWYVAPTGGSGLGSEYSPGTLGDITVYAQWVRAAQLTITGFSDGSAALTSAMQLKIRNFAKSNASYSNIECSGYTEGPTVLSSDRKLARERGIAVCSALQSYYGKKFKGESLKSFNLTQVAATNRKATITLSK